MTGSECLMQLKGFLEGVLSKKEWRRAEELLDAAATAYEEDLDDMYAEGYDDGEENTLLKYDLCDEDDCGDCNYCKTCEDEDACSCDYDKDDNE